ncbi:hypothetical protein EG68_07013 [Paragonimus skrjabini miyazakii]|uniref:Coiled-coil domain-containing protein 57 n=1 Tax=Paragonimus skrjabini miyazakii TaxID=59628 RepID=A0A8S9Z731_9TREM|nr:hypothetical protein EG68_07013 [Paragonimus skrjabini miyazakii]
MIENSKVTCTIQNIMDTIFTKESEWKNLLMSEVKGLEAKLDSTLKEMAEKNAQFEQLKDAFIHNLKLLKDRDTFIVKLEEQICTLKKTLHARDLLISETKASLDRCQSELATVTDKELRLRDDLDAQRTESSKRECELHKQYMANMNALKQSESTERVKLRTALTRLQADIEAERLRFSTDLEEALAKVTDTATQEVQKASQKQFGLELRLGMLEEMCERASKAKQEVMDQLERKEALIIELNSGMATAQKQTESLLLRVRELETENGVIEQKRFAAEAARSRLERNWLTEKKDLAEQLENAQAHIEWHKKELNMANLMNEEATNVASVERDRLLESLTRERLETQKALASLEEAKASLRLAEKTAKLSRNEAERLRKDLEQALLTPAVASTAPFGCGHQHLLEQLDRLQLNCDSLEEENARLRHSVSVMSEQAKQAAQIKTPKLTHSVSVTDCKALREKLKEAVGVIQQLAKEKYALIELSNRLQSMVRQTHDKLTVKDNKKQCNDDKQHTVFTHKITALPTRENELAAGYIFLGGNQRRPGHANDPVVPVLDLREMDDAVSSVMGKESISALFQLLDESTSNFDESRQKKEAKPQERTMHRKNRQLQHKVVRDCEREAQ